MNHLYNLMYMPGGYRYRPGNRSIFSASLHRSRICSTSRQDFCLPGDMMSFGTLLHKVNHTVIANRHTVEYFYGRSSTELGYFFMRLGSRRIKSSSGIQCYGKIGI